MCDFLVQAIESPIIVYDSCMCWDVCLSRCCMCDHTPFCERKLLATMKCADNKKNIDFSNNNNYQLAILYWTGAWEDDFAWGETVKGEGWV